MIEALYHDTSLWLAVSFVLFAYILWAKGWPVIDAALQSRINDIREELKNAENLRIEAQEMLAQYQRKNRDSLREAEVILRNAEKQAEHMRREAETSLQTMLTRREAQLTEKLSMMKTDAIAEIRDYASALSIQATREIILETLDAAAHENLTSQSIASLPRNIQ